MNKFKKFELVFHEKTKGVYVVCEIPENKKRLECCNESYYEYKSLDTTIRWIRCKSEMEDGRFRSMQ